MDRIEVLVATMHQTDFSLIDKMNLQGPAVIANQADTVSFQHAPGQDDVVMVTTNTRGVGFNRNLALSYSKGDFCALADDDMIFDDGYEQIIRQAFEEVPDADMLIFNLDTISSMGREARRVNTRVKRLHLFNILNYGAARIVFRRDSVQKANLFFTLLFGGGCQYSNGEDSLFLVEALRRGLRVYTYPKRLAVTVENESTWFHGYDEAYFHGRGCWIAAAFPKVPHLWALPLGLRWCRLAPELGLFKILRLMFDGIRDFREN